MILDQVEDLRVALKTEKKFPVIMGKFFELSEGSPAFMAASKPINGKTSRALERIIEACLTQFRGSKVSVRRLDGVEFKKAGLIHGNLMSGAGMGAFFYFRDQRQGLMALMSGDYFRITAEAWNEEGETLPVDILEVDMPEDGAGGDDAQRN